MNEDALFIVEEALASDPLPAGREILTRIRRYILDELNVSRWDVMAA